jgi:hypothetical protein
MIFLLPLKKLKEKSQQVQDEIKARSKTKDMENDIRHYEIPSF